MSRKESPEPNHGFGEIMGVALLVAALLLLAAQISFDRYDLSFIKNPPNHPAANWIGPFGAWLAYVFFFLLGAGAYLLPVLLVLFGLAALIHFPAHLRQRPFWSIAWSVLLIVALDGLCHQLEWLAFVRRLRDHLAGPSVGGWTGQSLEVYGFWMLGSTGAAIVYVALCLISLLFLTNFRFTDAVAGWRERRAEGAPALSPEERDLDRKARELEKKKKQLEEEVQKSGLGIDE